MKNYFGTMLIIIRKFLLIYNIYFNAGKTEVQTFFWHQKRKKRGEERNSSIMKFYFINWNQINVPGPLEPPSNNRPRRNITALSYSWTTCWKKILVWAFTTFSADFGKNSPFFFVRNWLDNRNDLFELKKFCELSKLNYRVSHSKD